MQSNSNNDNAIYQNWIKVQEETKLDSKDTDESIYDRLSEKYFALYNDTNEITYLRFSLFEAGRNKRQKIVNQLSPRVLNRVSNTLDLLNGHISKDTYSKKPFSPEDLYLFFIIPIPDSLQKEAAGLLNSWEENLIKDFQRDSVKAAIKAHSLIYGYNELNDFQKVYEVGKHLINNHPLPISLYTFNLFTRIAYAARVTGYNSDALKIYQNTLLPIADSLGDGERNLRIRMAYANTLFRIGNINEALNHYEYVYSQGIKKLDPVYQPALLNNLAISYLNSGRFDQYVQFQLEAFEIAREEENYEQQLDILRNLSIFYRRQNETQLAINYLNQALQVAEENNLESEISSILLSLGIFKRETDDNPREALTHFYDALELSQQSDEYQQQVNSYIDISETYAMLGEYEQAVNFIEEAIQLTGLREDERNNIQAKVRYANILTETEQFEKAGSIISEISTEDLQQIPFYVQVLGYNVNIKLLVNSGKISEAYDLSESIVDDILSWLEESADLQTGHMRMDEEFTETFRLYTDVLYKLGNYNEAVTLTGKLRNLSRTGFYNNPLLKSQILTEEQLIQDYNLGNRIEDLRSRYANANEEQKVYLQNQLVEAISERNRLQDEAFPNYDENSYEETLPQAIENLDSGQLVIYFSVFENQIFQFLISNDGVDMKAYPADEYYVDLIEDAVSSFGHASTDLERLYEVYKTYFEGNIPEHISHIYLIPDGIFYRLPIEILPVNPVLTKHSYGSSTYLIENYSVSYLNTLADLVTGSPDSEFDYDMAGFGVSDFSEAGHTDLPDLPFSPKEITRSAEKLKKFKDNRFFIDDNSTESNFREIAGKSKIIHLATHSKVNDENPLFSSLYLHKGSTSVETDSLQNENDGIIHAYELFDMNLNADLIFLSSCESGTGGYLKGSGILGFSRAFAYAGAQSLSMNLWPIRDQTASDISSHFYESLNEGKNKAEALREARLAYLNNTNSDPYLWGAFIMYGNIESPISNYQILANMLIPGLLLTGLFIIAILVYQKKALIKSWIL